MRTISYRAEDLRTAVIGIGYVGENEHTQVRIDCGTIFAEYPAASAGMTIVPPAGAAYPKVVTRDGDVVVWDVTDSDLASEGSGEMQLSFVVSNVVVKSCIAQICVQRSITGNGPAPDPMDDWLTEASETLAEVDEALAAIPETIDTALEQAKASGEFDGPQGEPGQDGQDGAPGADGFSPTATVTKSGKVATITITDKNGTTTATVSDGEGGGAEIDDTAGEGDTDKAWSADKLTDEFGSVLNDIDGVSDDVDDLLEHETYSASGEATTEYIPVVENNHVDSNFIQINGYNYATFGSPFGGTTKIYPVEIGKTYKVKSDGKSESPKMPFLIVADTSVTSGVIGTPNTYDSVLSESTTEKVEEIEYTALRTGYLYLTAANSSCGLWEKKTVIPTDRKYHIDDVMDDIADIDESIAELNSRVYKTKIDSRTTLSKVVPRNAEPVAKIKSVADSVTLVRSILSRNVANKNAVGDVVVDSIGTTKKGIQTAWVPPGGYWIDLGNMGIYSMVKYFEKGVYSATLWQDQFPMRVGITDPAGGFFVFYAENVSQLGDVSGLFVGKQRDGESVLPFEEYAEKTYTPEELADDNRIEVVPYGIIEFVNSSNSAVASTVEYTLFGKNDDTTTRKDFITSPDGTKYLPMIKNDGSVVAARVVPKKALFIGNSLTSGWQTFGEAATESDKDFVGRFGAVVADLDNNYTFNRKWSTQFEQQTSLANAQAWVTTNIDPLLSSDLDLIVVQLSDNVLGNASVRETFPSSSLWLLQHLRETCPKARVIWLGVWFDRSWVTTLLNNTAQTGCEYVDMLPIYLPENVSFIGEVYKMESPFQKEYTVDSFTVDDGAITMVFTVDGKQYTSTIPSYTSYESSGSTLTVTGIYHVVSTYYESIHPNDEGFRKIANKLLFDLGISDSEETIPADE